MTIPVDSRSATPLETLSINTGAAVLFLRAIIRFNLLDVHSLVEAHTHLSNVIDAKSIGNKTRHYNKLDSLVSLK